MRLNRRDLLAAVLLSGAALAVFGPAVNYEFVNYDDSVYVTENDHVKGGLTRENVAWAFTTFDASNWHPLTWLSLQLDATLFGPGPRGFHATNVALHAANAALLFLTLRSLTGAFWRSALVAALFALHPLRAESVAWVAERKDVLSSFFGLLALWAYAGYARAPSAGRYLGVALPFALGLLAKPMLVTLPFVLLLLDYWPLGRTPFGRPPEPHAEGPAPVAVPRLLLEKVPLFLLVAASCAATLAAQAHGGAVKPLEAYPFTARVGNALVAYAEYQRLAAWPAGLAPHYPHPGAGLEASRVVTAGLLLAALTGLAAWQARRRPYLLVGWLWYLGTLVPVVGLVQVGNQAYADRYTYLPLVGVALAAVWGAADLLAAARAPRWAVGVAAGAVVAGYAAACWRQAAYWHDSVALWERAARVAPSDLAAQQLCLALGKRRGPLEDDRRRLEELVRLRPEYGPAHNQLGATLLRLDRPAEALAQYREAARLEPGSPIVHVNLGGLLLRLGRTGEALAEFHEALRLGGGLSRPELARVRYNLGLALRKAGRPGEAAQQFRGAVSADPGLAQAHYNLGTLCEGAGDLAGAADAFREAVRHDPSQVRYRLALAAALYRVGRRGDAAAEYGAATSLAPRWKESADRQAWALATHPDRRARDGAQAVELAEQVCQATGFAAAANLDTLAAAYAEAGRFDEARAAARQALERATADGQSDLARGVQERLKRYEQNEPVRADAGRPP
jgi:tetratricopeptide (TPR) repeat protein